MARLPDAMDMGQRRVGDGRVPIVVDRSADIELEGRNQAAQQINAAVQRYAQQDDTFNFARARSALQSADIDLRSKMAEDDDWATQEKRYTDGMTKAREEASKLIQGSRSRAMFDMDSKLDVERGTEVIRNQAKEKEGHWGRAQLDDVLATNRTSALEANDAPTRASLMSGVQDAIAGALQKRYITPEQAKNLTQNWSASYGEGFVEVQPSDSEKLRLLRNPDDNPAKFIAPDKRQEMIRIIGDRMRVQTDRREAQAERAYAQAERQISSGVPITKASWTEWGAATKGTQVEKDFQGLVDAEKEVQTLLRKPVAEQLRTLEERKAKLDTEGGTMQDAMNFNRLQSAIKQNVALIQNSPLVYGEQRLGDKNVPVDIGSIDSPEGQQQAAAILDDRVGRIRGLQKTLGTVVPMKPLMPPEADQLVAVLDKASPQQSSALFASLRNASGSTDVFKGIMSQIAPDAPVKAYAGMLASNQRDLVTGNNWFEPDPSVKSTDVAATLVRGERLLNPSKADKTEDGKPKATRLLLPQEAQTELQTKFAKEVGTAFAGRPEVADRAFQAVQAYYVGRAAEKGELAENAQYVKPERVREAVRAVLGNVVDYNGAGQVLAPWGMTADDFENRVERKFSEVAKEQKLPPGVTPALSNFGLVNTDQDGLYGVKLGEKLLLDQQGNPVTLDIRDQPVRGVITR